MHDDQQSTALDVLCVVLLVVLAVAVCVVIADRPPPAVQMRLLR